MYCPEDHPIFYSEECRLIWKAIREESEGKAILESLPGSADLDYVSIEELEQKFVKETNPNRKEKT